MWVYVDNVLLIRLIVYTYECSIFVIENIAQIHWETVLYISITFNKSTFITVIVRNINTMIYTSTYFMGVSFWFILILM